jgi:hypothetical protein
VAREYLWRATLFAVALTGIPGCTGYVPGAKNYWDEQIKQLCSQDGGTTVYEQIELSREEFKRLGGIERAIPIPNEDSPSVGYPYVRRLIESKLNESNPEVIRSETQVIRRSDGKILGKAVRYSRRGGDFPTGIAEASSFACPQWVELTPRIFLAKQPPK